MNTRTIKIISLLLTILALLLIINSAVLILTGVDIRQNETENSSSGSDSVDEGDNTNNDESLGNLFDLIFIVIAFGSIFGFVFVILSGILIGLKSKVIDANKRNIQKASIVLDIICVVVAVIIALILSSSPLLLVSKILTWLSVASCIAGTSLDISILSKKDC